MPLTVPQLDDRTFEQLVAAARQRITQTSTEWTDLSPGDPGIVLLEVFAYLTDAMIYRLNRLPEKVYIAFLNLLGVSLYPPTAASVALAFSRSTASKIPIQIPRGTRVTLNRNSGSSESPIFTTAHDATIPAGRKQVREVLAYQCEAIDGELIGVGTGQPGQTMRVQRPPIIAPTGDQLDLFVAVETLAEELDERGSAIQYEGKTYHLWEERENFANLDPQQRVYVADRALGIIQFAPAVQLEQANGELQETAQALAGVLPEGREVRAWYRHGGGTAGNVPANSLTVLKDPIPGVSVTNPERATGGRPTETLENALRRGPQTLYSLQRAVTATDFENVAIYSSPAIARAKAFTRTALWQFAQPGTVEVLIVPYLSEEGMNGGRVTAAMLDERRSEADRERIQTALDERRPLGTSCVVHWAHYKPVRVTARIVIGHEEDRDAVEQRVIQRLYQTINPLPTEINSTGWPFGQALHASHVYDIALKEPGVHWIDQVQLWVDEVPSRNVTDIARDAFQSNTWYAGSEETLFRSINGGKGWEPLRHFPQEVVRLIASHPDVAGLMAVVTQPAGENSSLVYTSEDCGETWQDHPHRLNFEVEAIDWISRAGTPILLMATDRGLYEIPLDDNRPLQVTIEHSDPDMGFYAIATVREALGITTVALAAQGARGVYLSNEGGAPRTFRQVGLDGQDIRVLEAQRLGSRAFLWAGSAAVGGEDGPGCFRWELRGLEDDPEGWRSFSEGWIGGSCRALAFLGRKVLAASHHGGVMMMEESGGDSPQWTAPSMRSGLPFRDDIRNFRPVDTVAADPATGLVMAGGEEGVFSSTNEGTDYQLCSHPVYDDQVTLPPTWLFVSGGHEIKVWFEDEVERD